MVRIFDAFALEGTIENVIAGENRVILVYREDAISPDIILLKPPIPTIEANKLAVRIKTGEAYSELGIVSMNVVPLVPRDPEQSRWFIRR